MVSIEYMYIQLDMLGVLVSVILLLLTVTSTDRKSRLSIIFMQLALCNTGVIAFDLISWLCVGWDWQYALLVDHVSVFISYVLAFLMIPVFTDYVIVLIGENTKTLRCISRTMYIYFGIIVLLNIISLFNGMFFYYDQSNNYRPGELYRLSQLFVPFFILFMTYVIIRHKESLGKNNTVFIFIYFAFPLIAAVVSIINTEIELHYAATTISLIICYGGIQARQTKQAVRRMQIALNSLENIMDGINTSIYVVEPETCRLLFVNKWLKQFYGRENDDFAGEFCYKAFRGFDEMCSFCPCVRLAENPEQTVVWEEFLEPYGIYVRHLFCYIDWPDGEKAILHYGIDITEMHEKMDLLVKLEKQERELTESRISILLSQIRPHFLYNALVVIRHLCRIDPKTAEETVMEFSQYLRGNLDALVRNDLIPFEKELSHVETYLKIEKKRFGDKLSVVYEINAKDFRLPALTLQPIVENAVRYGVTKKEQGGTVKIKTSETERAFLVTVVDDGEGFDVESSVTQRTGEYEDDGQTHVGIENTRSRLETMCGGSLDIQSRPGEGTVAVMTIPKQLGGRKF